MKNTKKIISKILIYFALILGVLFCLVPLYWMIRSSLMNTVEVFMMPPRWIPSKFMWENYQEVFDTLPFGKYFLNSFIVTGGCVVGTMLTSSICAYGLARIKWRGRNVVFACIISSMMLPAAVTLIPTFLMWRTIGITDSFIPLIVPAWFGGGAFYIFLLRQFYLGIPRDFDEAAYLDGASHIQIFTKIIVPISKPIFASCTIVCLNNVWNEFLFANVFLESKNLMTIPIGLMTFKGDLRADYVTMLAGIIIASLPMIILFLCMSKQFVRGLTAGAVKG